METKYQMLFREMYSLNWMSNGRTNQKSGRASKESPAFRSNGEVPIKKT